MVEKAYVDSLVALSTPRVERVGKEERFAFYARAKKAYCIVATGDVQKYANLILKKGVTPPS